MRHLDRRAARPGAAALAQAALNLGCGTGSCAASLRRRPETVDGVDLSAAMLRKGQALGPFRQLLHSEVVAYLQTTEEGNALARAADVFIGVGALKEMLAGVRGVLLPGGRLDVLGDVCRHTLLRPRDLMTIGDRLMALRPDECRKEHRNEHRMMEAVHPAATEISHEYLAEIAPYTGELALERLFQRLPGPILTRAEVEQLCQDDETGAVHPNGCEPASRALYRVGLLGYVQHDIVHGEWRQRSLRPGDATLEPHGVLPRATHYLLHTVLKGVVGRLNPDFLGTTEPAMWVRLHRLQS